MRAAIYVRVSSRGQADVGSSLETQEAAARAYCAEHWYDVGAVYSDVHTGTEMRERPHLTALRSSVRAGDLDVIVAHAIDRLSRNQAHIAIIAEEAEEHGVRLEFTTEDF